MEVKSAGKKDGLLKANPLANSKSAIGGLAISGPLTSGILLTPQLIGPELLELFAHQVDHHNNVFIDPSPDWS